MAFCKRQNYGDSTTISGCLGFAERMSGLLSEIKGSAKVDLCHHIFVKTCGIYKAVKGPCS